MRTLKPGLDSLSPLTPLPVRAAALPTPGVMSRRIQAYGWSTHTLGPAEDWPPALTGALALLLASPRPMWLAWGTQRTFFCNDPYLPALGLREAWALGAPAGAVLEESWSALGPRVETVERTGEGVDEPDLSFISEREGRLEEVHLALSLTPLAAADGTVAGVLAATEEITARVVRDRRERLLRRLATELLGADSAAETWRRTAAALAGQTRDLAFLLVYQQDEHAAPRLAWSYGLEGAGPRFPLHPKTHAGSGTPWELVVPALATAAPFSVEIGTLADDLPLTEWGVAPRQAWVIPWDQAGRPCGYVVAGVSPVATPAPGEREFLLDLARLLQRALERVAREEDLRARGERQRQEAANLHDLIAHVGHELRTPLMLAEASLGDLGAGTPAFESSQRSLRRLRRVSDSLLDWSRAEAASLAPQFVPVDLEALTAEMIAWLRPAFARARLALRFEAQPLGETVFVDPTHWETMVLNLLSNALKFTATGSVRVQLRPVGECVEFSVQDTGCGIPDDELPHVFQRFHRQHGGAGRGLGGTGLGLSIVRQLVEAHGGRVHVESEPGVGSTFTLLLRRGSDHLPAGSVATSSSLPSPERRAAVVSDLERWIADDGEELEPPEGEAGGARVLVVEDDPDLRHYLGQLLAGRFHVDTVGDGETALQRLVVAKPDLVLVDLALPELSGHQLLRAIRARPEWRTLPVLILSAHATEEARVAGLDAGADDYLVKPFGARELLARVNVHLQMARIRNQAEERERELRTNAEMFARALRESGERLSASLTAADTGTFRWDLGTRALDIDEPLARLFGRPSGATVQSLPEFVLLIHPDDRALVLQAFEQSVNTAAELDVEFRVVLPDGSHRWLAGKARTFVNDAGQLSYMTGACADITRRKLTQAFVWRQREVLERILEDAPSTEILEALTLDIEQIAERKLTACILMADGQGRLTPIAGRRVPPGWLEVVTGLPIGPNSGSCGTAAFRNERVIVPDITASPLWERYVTEALRHGLRSCWSTPIVSQGGNVLGTFAIYHAEPATPTEQELHFIDLVARTAAIAVERDRSQRALRESQAQLAMHAQDLERAVQERTARLQDTISELESFSYSISHDMRAPLRAMQSFAEILADEAGENLSPEARDCIRRIIGAADRMDRLIHDVLMYSRVSRTELQLTPVPLEPLIDGILESYPQFHSTDARIEIVRPLPAVRGNAAALTQCFSNLIGNAIKFVPPGVRPEIRIWAGTHAGIVRVNVRDNGIGIAADAQEKIFQIFYQLDRSAGGTGIGLSVVRKAAERMGGRISLTSSPGAGSTFHLDLPAADATS